MFDAWHWFRVAMIVLFAIWLFGNVIATYQAGIVYDGEPNYDVYRESKGR